LVVRNFAVLDHRYPAYQAESVAFTFADPLAQSRQAIERSMPPSAKQPRLLLTGAGVMAIVTRERARQLISEQTSAMIVEVHYEATGPKARIFDAAGGIPQSLQFDLASPSECDAMMDYTRAAGPSAIEILDPAHVPLALVDRLLELGVRHDMFVGDATLVADRDVRATAAVSLRDDGFDPAFMAPNDDQAEKNRAKRWQDIADAADRILVPSEYARAYALKRFAESRLHRIVPAGDNGGELKGRRRGRAVWRLGLLPVRSCGEEQSLIAAIARAVRSSRPTAELTVVGATLDDLGLMQIGNTFVTGAVDSADFKWALRSYGLQALFLATTRPLFGHPSIDLAFACGLPVVYFDWSMGRLMPRKGGLALDPSISFTEMMKLIERWMAKS
jgi:hypothetical protein